MENNTHINQSEPVKQNPPTVYTLRVKLSAFVAITTTTCIVAIMLALTAKFITLLF